MPPQGQHRPLLPDNAAALSIALQMLRKAPDAAEELPTEFRIFAKDTNRTTKGTYRFSEESAKRCMEAARDYGNDQCIDYHHALFSWSSGDPAEQYKAAGWFNLELRDGELHAVNVRWTKLAQQKLKDLEYRYISPVFSYDYETGEIRELINVAITNLPATKGLEPLMASRDFTEERPMNPKLIALLALAATATEAEVLAAVEALKKRSESPTEPMLLSLTGKASASDALGAVAAWKQGFEQLAQVRGELEALRKTQADGEVALLVDKAIAEKKLAPAQKQWAMDLGQKDKAMLASFLSTAAPLVGEGARAPLVPEGAAALTQDDRLVAEQMGTNTEALAKVKAASRGAIPTSTREAQ